MVRSLQRFFHRRNHPIWGELEKVLGVPIYNYSLFEKALRHPSVERNQSDKALQSYERLEFLGDAVLGAVVAEYLYIQFPDEMEGFLTFTRSKLVSGEACAQIARDLGIGHFVELDPYMESQMGRQNSSILANCLESIIGAIHLDSGLTNSSKFIHRQILERVDLPQLVTKNNNHKGRLLEFVQAKGWDYPEYRVVGIDGPPHDSIFTVEVFINGHRKGNGQATSKKKAEQLAAHKALKSLSSNESTIHQSAV
ncbi:MAG: ribonuclease III [Bacteroidetes bacterium]|nr:ribonuclease III [Bacteroidota bacterium]MCY4205630.1 ribonuclease III [Bacteroidota bacterium]